MSTEVSAGEGAGGVGWRARRENEYEKSDSTSGTPRCSYNCRTRLCEPAGVEDEMSTRHRSMSPRKRRRGAPPLMERIGTSTL